MRNDHTRRLEKLETRSASPRVAVHVMPGQTFDEALQEHFGDGPRPADILFIVREIVRSPDARR